MGGLKQLLRNQVSLRSLILVFLSLRDLGDEWVTMGLPPQALPEGGIPPQTPFFASRRFKVTCSESGFASLPDSCFFIASRFGVTMGLPPQALPEGDSPSDSLLRFAAV